MSFCICFQAFITLVLEIITLTWETAVKQTGCYAGSRGHNFPEKGW